MKKERTMEEEFTRVEDTVEIYNLQSRYQHYMSLGKGDRIIELFAAELSDVSIEVADSGVFEGAKGIERMFSPLEEMSMVPGEYREQRAVQPVIEIAGDGKSAKGIWLSPGIKISGQKKLECWSWGKYDVDYIKLDGKWKIWHLKWYMTFECRREKGWLREQRTPISSMRIPEIYPPDKQTTHHMPYSPYRVNIMIPKPPEPYESHQE